MEGAGAGSGGPVVLITRPEPDGAAFAEALRRALPGPWRALLSPLARIVPLVPPALPEGVELILTSRNALRALAAGGRLAAAAGRPAWCVGEATARAAREAGLEPVEAEGPVGTADALVARILARRPGAPLLHLRGAHARGEVAGRLRAAGLDAREAVIYRQDPLGLAPEARAALAGAGAVIAPVFSPRVAGALSRAVADAGADAGAIEVVALSPAVAAALRLPGARARVCARPDAEAMMEALAEVLAPLLGRGLAEPG